MLIHDDTSARIKSANIGQLVYRISKHRLAAGSNTVQIGELRTARGTLRLQVARQLVFTHVNPGSIHMCKGAVHVRV